MRLPTRVHLPFGFRIAVKLVTDSEMVGVLGSSDPDEMVDGLWDDDTRTIYIRKVLSKKRQRYILSHELHHALLDWAHACLNDQTAQP